MPGMEHIYLSTALVCAHLSAVSHPGWRVAGRCGEGCRYSAGTCGGRAGIRTRGTQVTRSTQRTAPAPAPRHLHNAAPPPPPPGPPPASALAGWAPAPPSIASPASAPPAPCAASPASPLSAPRYAAGRIPPRSDTAAVPEGCQAPNPVRCSCDRDAGGCGVLESVARVPLGVGVLVAMAAWLKRPSRSGLETIAGSRQLALDRLRQ